MDTPRVLESVYEFHKTFMHPVEKQPIIPSKTRSELRISLIKEEVEELDKAIRDKNIVEIADAICDLQYVLAGAILEFGFGDKFKALFNEVQRSNMSKACQSEEEANSTIAYYKKNNNVNCHYEAVGTKYVVYRNLDNKIMKSINYSPANLSEILFS